MWLVGKFAAGRAGFMLACYAKGARFGQTLFSRRFVTAFREKLNMVIPCLSVGIAFTVLLDETNFARISSRARFYPRELCFSVDRVLIATRNRKIKIPRVGVLLRGYQYRVIAYRVNATGNVRIKEFLSFRNNIMREW